MEGAWNQAAAKAAGYPLRAAGARDSYRLPDLRTLSLAQGASMWPCVTIAEQRELEAAEAAETEEQAADTSTAAEQDSHHKPKMGINQGPPVATGRAQGFESHTD